MRILTIGGTGLISTAITRFLVERGDDVTLYNRGRRRLIFQKDMIPLRVIERTTPLLKRKWRERGISMPSST